MEDEGGSVTNCDWNIRYSCQRIRTSSGGLGNKRMSGDHPNDSIVQIEQNTK